VDPDRGPRLRGLESSSRKDLREFTASLLEAAGPLSLLGAQAIYLVEPFIPSRRAALRAWARLLEDPVRVRRWVRAVREESRR
jgi:hypothetical protein